MPERLFEEARDESDEVPNVTGAAPLATEIMSRSNEEWTLWRYLDTDTGGAAEEEPNPRHLRR